MIFQNFAPFVRGFGLGVYVALRYFFIALDHQNAQRVQDRSRAPLDIHTHFVRNRALGMIVQVITECKILSARAVAFIAYALR